MTAGGLAIIYLFPYVPKLGKLIPSPLVCIITLTIIAMSMGLDIRTVGDLGRSARYFADVLVARRASELGNLAHYFPLLSRFSHRRFARVINDGDHH